MKMEDKSNTPLFKMYEQFGSIRNRLQFGKSLDTMPKTSINKIRNLLEQISNIIQQHDEAQEETQATRQQRKAQHHDNEEI
jgi:hypothetical protein